MASLNPELQSLGSFSVLCIYTTYSYCKVSYQHNIDKWRGTGPPGTVMASYSSRYHIGTYSYSYIRSELEMYYPPGLWQEY